MTCLNICLNIIVLINLEIYKDMDFIKIRFNSRVLACASPSKIESHHQFKASKKILIIDDHREYRESTARSVKELDSICEEADSLKDAKEILLEEKFDFVFIDMHMGNKIPDAYLDIVNFVKKTPTPNSRATFICVSGGSDPGDGRIFVEKTKLNIKKLRGILRL